MEERYFKFKNNKHSVIMRLIAVDGKGNCTLQNKDYPIQHEARIEDLEEVKL